MNSARTPLFLMANLGSEVSRLMGMAEKGDRAHAHASFERAERIMDDIRKFPEMAARKREIDILADVISDVAGGQKRYSVSAEDLKSYFQPFALRQLSS